MIWDEEFLRNSAGYDQWDAAVRQAWAGLSAEERDDIKELALGLDNRAAACLLLWALVTMRKRDAEELRQP